MKHKIITTDNYLLVVDDSEIKENNYVYVEGHVKPQMCKGFENNGDVLCYNNLPYIKEKTKNIYRSMLMQDKLMGSLSYLLNRIVGKFSKIS